MHVAYLCEEYPPNMVGGIGVFLQTMSRALVARGHRVTVLGPWHDNRVRTDRGVEIREFTPSTVPKVGWYLTRRRWRAELGRLHADHRIDVVEAMDWQGFLFLVHEALPPSVARVVRLQGSQAFFNRALGRRTHALLSWLERRSLEAADHIVSISEFAYRGTLALFPVLSSKPHSILPNPVDTEVFHPRLNGATEPDLVMFVGTLTGKKGIAELVEAWPLVLRECPLARLELVAKDTRDPVTGRQWSEHIVHRLPASSRCRWIGPVDHDCLPETMARASVCVFPSHMETQSIVACEALALGKPVVFSREGPGPEVVVDGESGLLVDPRNPRAIADAIVRFLRDGELRARLGAAGRLRAEQRFSLARSVERNESLYQRLGGRP